MVKNIINSLVNGKKDIFNAQVKVSGRIFTLGGVGNKALKVKMNSPKGFPHLELSGFINWDLYDEFTPQEKQLVQEFYDRLP